MTIAFEGGALLWLAAQPVKRTGPALRTQRRARTDPALSAETATCTQARRRAPRGRRTVRRTVRERRAGSSLRRMLRGGPPAAAVIRRFHSEETTRLGRARRRLADLGIAAEHRSRRELPHGGAEHAHDATIRLSPTAALTLRSRETACVPPP